MHHAAVKAVVGEEALSSEDHLYLEFLEKSESRLMSQVRGQSHAFIFKMFACKSSLCMPSWEGAPVL